MIVKKVSVHLPGEKGVSIPDMRDRQLIAKEIRPGQLKSKLTRRMCFAYKRGTR